MISALYTLFVLICLTEGPKDLIQEGETGFFFGVDDAAGLADVLSKLACDPSQLAPVQQAALVSAQSHTHAGMHQTRVVFLKDTLSL